MPDGLQILVYGHANTTQGVSVPKLLAGDVKPQRAPRPHTHMTAACWSCVPGMALRVAMPSVGTRVPAWQQSSSGPALGTTEAVVEVIVVGRGPTWAPPF